jgi:hypothetical protein
MRERHDRILVTVAAVAPDIDGLGVIPELLTRNSAHPLLWFTEYHHVIAHSVLAAVVVCIGLTFLARDRLRVFGFALLSYHLHLFGDLLGSRGPDGYQWPIPYLYPFSLREWSWSGQWPLASWQNLLITVAMLGISYYVVRTKKISPVEIFSSRADKRVVEALT